MNKENKTTLLSFIVVAILSFILLFAGIRFVLEGQPNFRNIIAFAVFSLLVGIISSGLYLLKQKVSYWIYCFGVTIGFIMMYRSFLSDSDGWEELAGLLSLFFCIAAGLSAALLTQLGYFVYQKLKKNL